MKTQRSCDYFSPCDYQGASGEVYLYECVASIIQFSFEKFLDLSDETLGCLHRDQQSNLDAPFDFLCLLFMALNRSLLGCAIHYWY